MERKIFHLETSVSVPTPPCRVVKETPSQGAYIAADYLAGCSSGRNQNPSCRDRVVRAALLSCGVREPAQIMYWPMTVKGTQSAMKRLEPGS